MPEQPLGPARAQPWYRIYKLQFLYFLIFSSCFLAYFFSSCTVKQCHNHYLYIFNVCGFLNWGQRVGLSLTGFNWSLMESTSSQSFITWILLYVYVGLTFQLRVGQRLLYCSTWINKPAARYYSYKDSHGAMNMHNKKKHMSKHYLPGYLLEAWDIYLQVPLYLSLRLTAEHISH